MIKRAIKKVTRQLGFEISRGRPAPGFVDCVSLKTSMYVRGSALLSYRIEPFLVKPGEHIPNSHTHFWASFEIARSLLDFGYNVDAISYLNREFIPKREYSIIIDARHNLERLTPLLGDQCIKIMWLDTASILFHNAGEAARLLSLQQRRGVTLSPRRFELPNRGIEHSDYGVMFGNEFTIDTYQYAHKPIYRVPIPSNILCPWQEDKDFEAVRKNFLWLNSSGMVHKGLDLVIEAFCGLPDCHLTICGPVEDESDFVNAFYKELYRTPNIHTIGWVDIESKEFLEIAHNCVGTILASCSEGANGSVVNCMHTGLIPILSRESGIDVDPSFGFILGDCSVREIASAIRFTSGLPTDKLRSMSRNAWEFVRDHHTREAFSREWRKILSIIRKIHLQGGDS